MNCENCDKLQRELLSALAAIEKHNEIACSHKGIRIDVDLSLLHEHDQQVLLRAHYSNDQKHGEELLRMHDAEVRKPLVDALKELRTWTDAHDHERVIIDDALAKIKQ